MKTLHLPYTTHSQIDLHQDSHVDSNDVENIKPEAAFPPSLGRTKRSPTPGLSHIISFTFTASPSTSNNNTAHVNFISRFFTEISQNKWKELHAPAVMLRNINRSGNLLKDIKNEIGGEVFTNTSVGFNINRRDIINGCIKFLAQQERNYAEHTVNNRSGTPQFEYYHHLLNNETEWIREHYKGNYIERTSMLNVRAFSLLPHSIKNKFSTISDELISYGNHTIVQPSEKRRLESGEKKNMLMILLNHIAYKIKVLRDNLNNATSTVQQNKEKEKIIDLMDYQIEVMSEFYVSQLSIERTAIRPSQIYYFDKFAVSHFSGLVGQLERFRNEKIADIVDKIFTNTTTYTSGLNKIRQFRTQDSRYNNFMGESLIDVLSTLLELNSLTAYSNSFLVKTLSLQKIMLIKSVNHERKNNTAHYNGDFYHKLVTWASNNTLITQSKTIEDKKTFIDLKNFNPSIFNWKLAFCNKINEMIKSIEKNESAHYLDDNHQPLHSNSLIYIIINQRMSRAETFLKRLFPFTDFAESIWQNANNFADAKKAIRITFAEAVALYRRWNPADGDFNALILEKRTRALVEKISTKTADWENDLLSQVDNLQYDISYQISSHNVLKSRIESLKISNNIDIYTKTYDVNLTNREKEKVSLFFKGESPGYLVKLNNDIDKNQNTFPGIICIPLRKGNGTHDGYESVLISLNQQELVRLPALIGPERIFTAIENILQIDADKRHQFLDNLESRKTLHEKGYQKNDDDFKKIKSFLAQEMSSHQIPDTNSDYLTFVKMRSSRQAGPLNPGPRQHSFHETEPFNFENLTFSMNTTVRKSQENTLVKQIIKNKSTKLRDEIDDFIFTADNKWFTWDEREVRNTKEWMDMFIVLFSIGSVILPTPTLSFTSNFFLKYLPFTMLDLFSSVNSALLGKQLAASYDELKSSKDDLYKSIFYWSSATLSGAAISISKPLPKASYIPNNHFFIRRIYKDAVADPTFIINKNWDYVLSRMYGELSYGRSIKSALKNTPVPQHSLFYDIIDYSYLQITPLIRDETTVSLSLKNTILTGESSISTKIRTIEENINRPEATLINIAADLKNLDTELEKMQVNAMLVKNSIDQSTENYLQLSEFINLMPAVKSRAVELEKVLSQTIHQLNSLTVDADIQRIKRVFECSDDSAREISEQILVIHRKQRSINVGDLYRISHILGGGSKMGDDLLTTLRELTSVTINSVLNKTPEMLIVDGVTGCLDLYHKLFPLSNITTQAAEENTMNTTDRDQLHNLLGFWQPPTP